MNIIGQIFDQGAYAMGNWAHGRALLKYCRNELRGKRRLIIDAGANIGASAVWFKAMFPASAIFALEPDAGNAAVFDKNTQGLDGIKLFRGAIGNKPGTLFLNRGPRDSGHRVSDKGDTPVNVIDIAFILELPWAKGAKPLICKIDIEGGETPLFAENTGWMTAFPCIIVELHDWMMPFQRRSNTFLTAIAGLDFDLVHKGEHIFCYNNALLGHYRSDPEVMKRKVPSPPQLKSLVQRLKGLVTGARR